MTLDTGLRTVTDQRGVAAQKAEEQSGERFEDKPLFHCSTEAMNRTSSTSSSVESFHRRGTEEDSHVPYGPPSGAADPAAGEDMFISGRRRLQHNEELITKWANIADESKHRAQIRQYPEQLACVEDQLRPAIARLESEQEEQCKLATRLDPVSPSEGTSDLPGAVLPDASEHDEDQLHRQTVERAGKSAGMLAGNRPVSSQSSAGYRQLSGPKGPAAGEVPRVSSSAHALCRDILLTISTGRSPPDTVLHPMPMSSIYYQRGRRPRR